MLRTTLLGLSLLAAASADASPRIELGVALGGHDFSSTNELGAPDDDSFPGPQSAAMIGARVAVPLTDRLAIEGEGMIIPTGDDVKNDDVMVYGLRAHVRFDLLTGKVRPFLVAGAGMHILRTDSVQMYDDVDPAFHTGGGIRWAVTDSWDVRLDGRWLIVPDRTKNGATSDYESTIGVTYRFGHVDKVYVAPPPPPPPAPPPPPPVVAAPPPPPPPPPPAPVIEALAGIGFELDSAKIDKASEPILERAYDLLEKQPKIEIEISGHTSSEGDPDRNMKLSLARAEAVKDYLVKRGIAAERIQTVGHGSDDPIGDNTTDEGRRKNRRIEFRIMPPSDAPPP